MGGGGLQVIIVSVHVLYFIFTHVYVRQDRLSGTPVYIKLRQFISVGRDMELDKRSIVNKKQENL